MQTYNPEKLAQLRKDTTTAYGYLRQCNENVNDTRKQRDNARGRLTEVRNRNYHPDSDAMKTAEKRFNTAQDDFQQADAERAEASEAFETVKRLLDSCEAFIAQHELTPRLHNECCKRYPKGG